MNSEVDRACSPWMLASVLAAALLAPMPGAARDADALVTLPKAAVEERGELLLDERGDVLYRHWDLQPLRSPAHIGMLIVMPARFTKRNEIASFEKAMNAKNYDYRRLASTSIINLADATWGASLFVEQTLRSEKRARPDLHLVVDERGDALRMLAFEPGTAHVVLYDCRMRILAHHRGQFTPDEAGTMLGIIDKALRKEACSAVAQ